MPTDDVILVRVGFLFDGVVNNQHTRLGLHLANQRFDDEPQISRSFLRAG